MNGTCGVSCGLWRGHIQSCTSQGQNCNLTPHLSAAGAGWTMLSPFQATSPVAKLHVLSFLACGTQMKSSLGLAALNPAHRLQCLIANFHKHGTPFLGLSLDQTSGSSNTCVQADTEDQHESGSYSLCQTRSWFAALGLPDANSGPCTNFTHRVAALAWDPGTHTAPGG